MDEKLTEILTDTPEKTADAGAWLAKEMIKDGNTNAFIALYGELGAGKTAFTRGLASVLAPQCAVKSPTYTIVNVYKGASYRINHFDMYRIADEDDLYSTGFYDYIDDGVTVCEWSEKIPFALPESYFRVSIEYIGAQERKITICKVNGGKIC